MLQLLPMLAIIVAVFLTDNKGSIVKSEMLPFCGYTTNRTSTCHGAEILSPFWIENRRMVDDTGRDCMGYPRFQLKCAANGRLLINISNNLYYVYRATPYRVLTGVVDVDIEGQDCLQPPRNFSIGSDQRFLSVESYGYINLTIFYNCSRYPPDVVENIPCLNQNNKSNSSRSFAFIVQEIQSNQFEGVLMALRDAAKHGINRVWIECDNVAVVRSCQEQTFPWWCHANVSNLLSRIGSVRFSHIWREGNKAADCLAKKGSTLGEGVGGSQDGRPDFLYFIEAPYVPYLRCK